MQEWKEIFKLTRFYYSEDLKVQLKRKESTHLQQFRFLQMYFRQRRYDMYAFNFKTTPFKTSTPIAKSLPHATFASGSCFRWASKIASEI